MKKIIHIQHCESVHHTNGMIGSSTDWELSENGIKQAHNIGRKLKDELKEKYVIYSSNLKRAYMTANIVNEYLDSVVILEPRLRERHLGEAVGKSVQWAKENSGPWSHDINHIPFTGSETVREHFVRVNDFLQDILSNDEDNIIIVSHGGTKSVFQVSFLDIDIAKANEVSIHSKAGTVSQYIVQDDGHKRVISIGDTYYRND